MAVTVAAILDGAYNRSAANDAGKLAGDPELVAHLDRVYQRAWALVARARPDAFAATTALTLAGIPPTATLPADLIALVHMVTEDGDPVSVVAMQDRQRSWNLAPVVFRRGRSIVSRNLTGDPAAGDVLTCDVLDAPTALATRASSLDARWPSRHAQLLVDALAVYLSTKDAGRSSAEHAKIVGELQQSAAAFASEFGLAPADVEWLHAPVERAGGGS